MEPAIPTPKIHEALEAMGRYYSDMIPPFQASEALDLLIRQPVQLMSIHIINWASAQVRINKNKISMAEHLHHVVGKLHYLAHLQLISDARLEPYLDEVKQQLLEYCPIEDRGMLLDQFNSIQASDHSSLPEHNVSFHQQPAVKSHANKAPADRGSHFLLWERLEILVRNRSLPGAGDLQEAELPCLAAMIVLDAQTNKDFHAIQDQFQSLGLASGTDSLIQLLSRGLPGWAIHSPLQPGTEKSDNIILSAMSRIVRIAEDKWDGGKRFQEIVQAAIGQFNSGSLARAVTMLELSLKLIFTGALEPAIAASVRKTAHQSLDMDRLGNVMKDERAYPLLRTFLNFFDEYTVPNMLNYLQQEKKRERRRLLLGLLKVHGNEARNAAFERLKMYLAGATVEYDWYFARNLLCTVTAVPRSNDIPLDAEMRIITRLLNLDLPLPLVKEAVKYAGQVKCNKSEELLITTAEELETIVHKSGDPEMLSLLDRVIFTLAHYGTPNAYRTVVKHGASGQQKLGDTASRLVYLSSRDLASDPESLTRLIKFLKSKAPRRILGMTVQKSDPAILHAIRALSSTSALPVREAFKEIADQYPDTAFGAAAINALKDFEALDKSRLLERTLSGSLVLFGLPDLLSEMHTAQLTGILTIRDADRNPVGTFQLHVGRILNCSAGHREGIHAACQLIETPLKGTYHFQGRTDASHRELGIDQKLPEIRALLAEGMRRYDALQRARTLLPDSMRLHCIQEGPPPAAMQDDQELIESLWLKIYGGAAPEECEAGLPYDACSVRTLLVRWVEEGFLAAEPPDILQ